MKREQKSRILNINEESPCAWMHACAHCIEMTLNITTFTKRVIKNGIEQLQQPKNICAVRVHGFNKWTNEQYRHLHCLIYLSRFSLFSKYFHIKPEKTSKTKTPNKYQLLSFNLKIKNEMNRTIFNTNLGNEIL